MPAEISAAAPPLIASCKKAPLPHYNPNANANVKQNVFMGFLRDGEGGGGKV